MKIQIDENISVGDGTAEYDKEFIDNCFFYHPTYDSLKQRENQKRFVYGRTGVGKSAFLQKIHDTQERSVSLDLSEIALDYLINNDALRFLTELGINLEPFFQALWKHMVCLEFIKLKFKITDRDKSVNFFESLKARFSKDNSKARALAYLDKYATDFWVDTDKIVEELTTNVSNKIDAEAGGEYKKFRTKLNFVRNLSREKKESLKQRLKHFINAETLGELNQVMTLLKSYDTNNKDTYYILIDGIDENWVDESIRYNMIRSLIEIQKPLRRLTDLKVLVALRADIFERVMQESTDPGQQREKYNATLSNVRWDKLQLKKLIDIRISHSCKSIYTGQSIGFDDIFTNNIGREKPFNYLLDRTLLRPRDIITFVNECLKQASGHSSVTQRHVIDAEREYSRIRVEALQQEWLSALPCLQQLLEFISSRRHRFILKELLTNDEIDILVLKGSELHETQPNDPIYQFTANNWKTWDDAKDRPRLRSLVASELYRVGAVGLKPSSSNRVLYSHKDAPILAVRQIDQNTSVHVHKFLHSGINISSGDRSRTNI